MWYGCRGEESEEHLLQQILNSFRNPSSVSQRRRRERRQQDKKTSTITLNNDSKKFKKDNCVTQLEVFKNEIDADVELMTSHVDNAVSDIGRKPAIRNAANDGSTKIASYKESPNWLK